MPMNNVRTAERNAVANALVDPADVGSTNAAGNLGVFTTAFAALLVAPVFANPAFPDAVNGVATANAIVDGTAVATGTAAEFGFRDRDDARVWDGDVGVTGGGQDLLLSSTSIVTSETLAISSFILTFQP